MILFILFYNIKALVCDLLSWQLNESWPSWLVFNILSYSHSRQGSRHGGRHGGQQDGRQGGEKGGRHGCRPGWLVYKNLRCDSFHKELNRQKNRLGKLFQHPMFWRVNVWDLSILVLLVLWFGFKYFNKIRCSFLLFGETVWAMYSPSVLHRHFLWWSSNKIKDNYWNEAFVPSPERIMWNLLESKTWLKKLTAGRNSFWLNRSCWWK